MTGGSHIGTDAAPGQTLSVADQFFASALRHHQRGQLAEAESLYRKALAAEPRHTGALHFAGLAALQKGANQDAVALIEQSLALRDDAQAHYHLGLAFAGLHRFEECAAQNRCAIALQPTFIDAHTNLGNALKALGKLDEAEACFRHVVDANPKLAAAHYNLANLLVDKRESDAAICAYGRALAVDPSHLSARQNLATVLLTLGRLDDAIAQFKIVSAAGWNFAEVQLGHALALKQKGETQEALVILCRVLDFNPSAAAKSLFVQSVRSLAHYMPILGLKNHLVAALTEPWDRPRELAFFASAALRTEGAVAAIYGRAAAAGANFKPTRADLEALAADPLLLAVLENAAIADLGLERILTTARRELVAIAVDNASMVSDGLLTLACALAQQCFVNEYVFDLTVDEVEQALALRDRLAAESPSALVVAVIASYFPLHEVAGAERLLSFTWPMPVNVLLAQQLREPRVERDLQQDIPRLTPIDDTVSLKVQRQYEENPYPRWVKIARIAKLVAFDDYVRKILPFAPFRRTENQTCDILVAGCGTGQQSLEFSLEIAGAKILAVDLSRASLAHAQRKARELAVDDIEYAQADILRLSALGRTFDFIAASGVLHHMADPFTAWHDLTGLLRPRGVMLLSVYSKTATPHVLAARTFAATLGLDTTADGIRHARQAIMALPEGELAKGVTMGADFFSASECRDLLFHVQEQRLTIPQLKSAIDAIGVRFLGFHVPHSKVIESYRARFPHDVTLTDLDNWQAFETDNPYTFVGMYQFLLQKPDGNAA